MHRATKFVAFMLTVILLTAAVVQFQVLLYKNKDLESLFIKEYKDSNQFFMNDVYDATRDTLNRMKDPTAAMENIHYYYYISDGEQTYTNAANTDKRFFAKYDNAFYAYERGIWTFGEGTLARFIINVPDQYTVYIAFPNEYLQTKQTEWEALRSTQVPLAVSIVVCLVLAVLLIILLLVVTGRRPTDKLLHFSKLDSIYSELLIGAMMVFAALWYGLVREAIMSPSFHVRYPLEQLDFEHMYALIWVGLLTVTFTTLCGLLLLSLTRKVKAGKLFKHTLVYTVGFAVYDFSKSLFDGRKFARYPLTKSLFYRQLIFISASAVLVFFTLLFFDARTPLVILPPIIETVLIYWFIKGNNQTFDDINKGFNESLEDQMRAERMKIELVTNVSHDLKTPLTSIISYVDLLSKEENLSETASDYVKILVEKSNRLKSIVSDLFDLAKSTSGDITLDLENLDLKKLIEQTLGDMEQDIIASNLQIKTKLPDDAIMIYSDGKKLYRVFQNIIDNALKYSLQGTRVYVGLEERDGKAVATIKNTASYEMDFTAEEILQRFNRGDKSRTSEGSGLGLSIAESFTRICGGDFKVDIDGDLFKVTLLFNMFDTQGK